MACRAARTRFRLGVLRQAGGAPARGAARGRRPVETPHRVGLAGGAGSRGDGPDFDRSVLAGRGPPRGGELRDCVRGSSRSGVARPPRVGARGLRRLGALREPQGWYYDTRIELSRLTAHLALAEALAPGQAPTRAGRVARIALDTVAGRRVAAIGQLDAAEAEAWTAVGRSWLRALRIWNTRDWRLAGRQPSEVERAATARALTVGVSGLRALASLGESPREVADWGRHILGGGLNQVGTGNALARGVVRRPLRRTGTRLAGRAARRERGGLSPLSPPARRLAAYAGPASVSLRSRTTTARWSLHTSQYNV